MQRATLGLKSSGMPFQLQGTKGALELAGLASICAQDNWKAKLHHHQQEVNSFSSSNNTEPTSVLHMRRSPSPPTSASTLSSSFNGASAAGNSADNTIATPTTAAASHIDKKEEWANELQPIPSGLEIVAGTERCGLGMEDWETMWPESAASPSQEHSLLRWIAGDIDDGSFGLKQLLQSGSTNNGNNNTCLDFDGNAGLGIVDQGPGLEPINNLIANAGPSLGAFPGSGFNGNGKIGSITTPQPPPAATSGASSGVGVNANHKVGSATAAANFNIQSPVFNSPANNLGLPVSLPPCLIYQSQQQQFVEAPEEKPQILNPQVLMSQHHQQTQNPNFILPFSYGQQEQHLLHPQLKRHNSGGLDSSSHQIPKLPFSDPGHELLLRKQQQQHVGMGMGLGFSPQGMQFFPQHVHQQKPLMVAKQKMLGPGEEMTQNQHHHQLQQQQHALLDQLYKAAELVGTGNFSHAQGILARLNHQLSPVGKPLQRAAFYFKEALQLLLLMNNPVTSPPPRSPTPFDVIFKMGAYKVFSDVSPLIQFVNFTCNQALLEALEDADRIHIVDFDIGFGAQWASFMQELPIRSRGSPLLRITAFASPSTHHPVELALMRDNLTQFANEIGVSFELEVINIDSLEQTSYSLPIFRSNESEAFAVNFPIWSSSNQPSALPSLLRFVKQLSPKILVSLDRGCDRNDLPFPQHIIHALHSYISLFESLDALNVTSDAVNKIERFLLQPRIENTVLGRLRAPEKMPVWKTLFASAGFTPVTFSNFAETQAECVVKRSQVRGFHIEKRHASLALCWQRRELISASAWRC